MWDVKIRLCFIKNIQRVTGLYEMMDGAYNVPCEAGDAWMRSWIMRNRHFSNHNYLTHYIYGRFTTGSTTTQQ